MSDIIKERQDLLDKVENHLKAINMKSDIHKKGDWRSDDFLSGKKDSVYIGITQDKKKELLSINSEISNAKITEDNYHSFFLKVKKSAVKMDKAIESFINNCDTMMIAEEGSGETIDNGRVIKSAEKIGGKFYQGSLIVRQISKSCLEYAGKMHIKGLTPKIWGIQRDSLGVFEIAVTLTSDDDFFKSKEFSNAHQQIVNFLKEKYSKDIEKFNINISNDSECGDVTITVMESGIPK